MRFSCNPVVGIMAQIKVSNYEKRSGDGNEMRVSILHTVSGAEYEFTLKRKHLEVRQKKWLPDPEQPHAKGRKADWFEVLTEAEKVQLFAVIMDTYRDRSLGDNGFRGAAIGVVPEKREGQSRLFIGTNTTRWASPYFKDCAEQNMVNAATDTLAFERARNNEALTPARLKAVYVMQGVNDYAVPMACPCGKCTDMLAQVMESESAPVTTIPLLTEALRTKIKQQDGAAAVVAVNEAARSLNEIEGPIDSQKCTAWKKPIGYLNGDRQITLNDDRAALQRKDLPILIRQANSRDGLPEVRGARNQKTLHTAYQQAMVNSPKAVSPFKQLATILDDAKWAGKKIAALLGVVQQPAEKAVENIVLQRHSEAGLDCAVSVDGTVDLGKLNQFLVMRIRDTLADRMAAVPAVKRKTDEQRCAWVSENIQSIRCVAIQLDDGTFHYAVQTAGKLDNAMPNAEVVALENAVAALGRNGVRHVWAMEFNPHAIEAGKMLTSPKEGVERLVKRASTQGIDFHFIPFNAGGKAHEAIESIMENRTSAEIYPGGHKGYLAAVAPKTHTQTVARSGELAVAAR